MKENQQKKRKKKTLNIKAVRKSGVCVLKGEEVQHVYDFIYIYI